VAAAIDAMNILLAHNYYRSASPSGENQAFDAERDMLRRNGHRVFEFLRHSDNLEARGIAGKLLAALSIPWNFSAASAMEQASRTNGIEVVHVHNTFPLISPSVFHATGTRAARVMTLHNYRLFCPAAIPLRAGRVCTECLDRHSTWPALQYACYRDSRLATLPLAAGIELHRRLGTWQRQVDAFIVMTEFQRERLIDAGLPAELVHVKPNFFPGSPNPRPWAERRPCVVFAGRLSAEKGLPTMLRAWQDWGAEAPELRIVGDGTMRAELEKMASNSPQTDIRFLGRLSPEATRQEIANARLLLLPSECFEGFPMVLAEAFAFGTPVAASAIGPLPTIVDSGENGTLFAAGNAAALLATVRALWHNQEALEQLSGGARRAFDAHYTEAENHRILMQVYECAIAVSRQRKTPR
jgi:glycosyltransferase involved in cell wall biosynthesis